MRLNMVLPLLHAFSENQRKAIVRLAETCSKRGADHAWQQLGHREREAVYQRALAAELEASGWAVELEAPIPVVYTTLPGVAGGARRTVVLSHDRADIVARRSGFIVVIEIKKGGNLTDARDQATRYGLKLREQGNRVAGIVVARFPKSPSEFPTIVSAGNLEAL